MFTENPQTTVYVCPNQTHPVSRAVHLGRMARFFPGCRRCAHRDDTGTLSAKQVERLRQARPRGCAPSLFGREGAGGVYPNELQTHTIGKLAAALGIFLQTQYSEHGATPTVVLAGDGRPLVAEPLAAAAEALRWTGCNLVDLGATTAASMALAIDQLSARGGLLLGSSIDRPRAVGLKFWAPGPQPLSAGGSLEKIERIFRRGTNRPARTYGSLRRFRADVPYLESLVGHYHALRPLRIVLHSASNPLERYLRKLTDPLACRVVSYDGPRELLERRIRSEAAHFAARADDDGEICRVFDEQGRAVSDEQLLLLIATYLLRERPGGLIALEKGVSASLAKAIHSAGGKTVATGNDRRSIFETMRRRDALCGGGNSGRIWYTQGDHHAADALMTITHLLAVLSRGDHPLSKVLDRAAKRWAGS